MATHPGMLIAYDDNYNVIGTMDHCVLYDEDKKPIGLVDFAAHEEAGGDNLAIWNVNGEIDGQPFVARGSKVWPEYLGARAHEFKVELEGPAGAKRIAALVHKKSSHRRVRADIEAAIEERIKVARDKAEEAVEAANVQNRDKGRFVSTPRAVVQPEPVDIRDLVGGPDRPLEMDENGRGSRRAKDTQEKVRMALPVVPALTQPPDAV
jgi:hypothetical protein